MSQSIASYRLDRTRCLCRCRAKLSEWHTWTIRLALLLSCLLASAGMALAQTATEYQVKAAFLYNFTKFIEWPESSSGASDPFTLCIYGANPFGGSLENLVRGKTIKGRPFGVRDVTSSSQTAGCQVLFISRAERGHMADILAGVHRAGLLTVGETKGFIDQGGVINFIMESNHVRFAINLRAAQRAGLKISSRLLNLATEVKR
jgi:hypothetical protein